MVDDQVVLLDVVCFPIDADGAGAMQAQYRNESVYPHGFVEPFVGRIVDDGQSVIMVSSYVLQISVFYVYAYSVIVMLSRFSYFQATSFCCLLLSDGLFADCSNVVRVQELPCVVYKHLHPLLFFRGKQFCIGIGGIEDEILVFADGGT